MKKSTLSNFKSSRLKEVFTKELKRRGLKKNHYNWLKTARPNQLPPPGEWRTWLILAGRGFGKTRAGAETIRQWVKSGQYKRLALVGRSVQDVRSIMVEGESGLLAIHPSRERPKFEASTNRLTWPDGAIATLYGADHYDKLRGPQFDGAWVDEIAKFRYPQEAWDQLMLCLRLGKDPKCIVTTTPKPIIFLEKLMQQSDVVITRGTTFDNKENLAPAYIDQILKQYEGTRLGAQELYAQILSNKEGALWHRDSIIYKAPPIDSKSDSSSDFELKRIVIAIDPAITHTAQSDETGIIVAGIDYNNEAYILEDLSGKFSPADWGQRAVKAYWHYKADRIVAEVNKGGDMVERIIRSLDSTVSYKAVRATRGKGTRAEPIAALYEQKKIFHIRPLETLETQLCEYIPGISSKSPDRLDALVWALTELMLERENNPVLKVWGTG